VVEGRSHDVVILGGGPGGAATGLALSRHDPSLSVALVEASDYASVRIGETLSPRVRELLAHLGVWEAFLEDGHGAAYGTSAAWGGEEVYENEFLFHAQGEGWHLDRRRFDALLAREAERAGVAVFRGARYLRHRARRGGGWELHLRRGEEEIRLEAPFVVDATGRRAAFARRQGASRVIFDRLLGLYLFFELESPELLPATFTLVEAWEEGWWYSARLPGDRVVVALMSDGDRVAELGLRRRGRWLEELGRTRHTRRVLAAGRPGPGPTVHAAQSQLLAPVAGSAEGRGWLAVGDAASTFDPLSSHGIFKALRFGIYAAYAAADFLRGEGPDRHRSLDKYQRRAEGSFESYLATRTDYYRQEQRWPEAPFWRRRFGLIALSPRQILTAVPEKAAEARREPALYLPAPHLEHLWELCRTPRPAHEVVTACKQGQEHPASDHRIILALEHLLARGVLRVDGSSPA